MMKRNLMYRNEGIMESNEKIYSTRPTVNDISVAEMLQQSIDEGKIDSEMYNELIQEFPSTLQEELKSNIKIQTQQLLIQYLIIILNHLNQIV